jgi:hypothetical protein
MIIVLHSDNLNEKYSPQFKTLRILKGKTLLLNATPIYFPESSPGVHLMYISEKPGLFAGV